MKYFGKESDINNSNGKTGVLLVNLGTPDRPVCPGLRKYLSEFLMDPRIIEIPALLRFILVRGIIVNFRSHKSARTYREIWTDDGSPLLVNAKKLSSACSELLGDDFHVALAMRYGQPSVESQLKELHQAGIRELVVVPMFPQYSGSTNGSVFDAVAATLKKFRWVPKLHFINSYAERDDYIAAMASSIREHWQTHPRGEKLIMSFHGVPQKYVTRGDPYQAQCAESAQAIAAALELADDEWMLVFQSRFGAEEWLTPYCDETLKSLPGQGIKSVDIVCPGFSADCLETLEEIEQENREYFVEAGGEQYTYIPCLNDRPDHAQMLAQLVRDTLR